LYSNTHSYLTFFMNNIQQLYRISTLVFVLCFSQNLWAQLREGYLRVGVSMGITNYQGDLSDDHLSTLLAARPGFGITGSYHFSSVLSARLSLFHGRIEGKDANSNRPGKVRRNLSFRSSITEVSGQLVFDFIPTDRSYEYRPKLTPYGFMGISVFTFNPQAQLNGQWIELQPLGTEGQYLPDPDNRYPDPYNLAQISIPLGFGLRYAVGRLWNIELESGVRKTWTDYLDDVSTFYVDQENLQAQNPLAALLSSRTDLSQFPEGNPAGSIRGNPDNGDWYVYTNISISFIIDQVRCPSFR